MLKYFRDIVDYEFTAEMEDELDSIANGKTDMKTVLTEFYTGFEKDLENAEKTVSKDEIVVPEQETDIICEKCGARMVVKQGRFGKFAACPNYPECRNTKPLDKDGKPVEKNDTPPEKTGELCPLCGGDMLKRHGRYGDFIACSNYPKCKNTKQILKPIGVPCPKCGAQLVVRTGKNRSVFYSCERHPDCDFVSWDMPTNEKCPQCGNMLFIKKGRKQLVCHDKECGYKKDITDGENEQS